MFDEVIVPVDGSLESARALRPASAISRFLGTAMSVVAYHSQSQDGFEFTQLVQSQVRDSGDLPTKLTTAPMTKPVCDLLADDLEDREGALLVMNTRGHGRSAGLIGSVANKVLATTRHPVMLIGPECDVDRFRLRGPMVVATDASRRSGPALDLAAQAVKSFEFAPVLVNVIEPATSRALQQARTGAGGFDMVPESAMVQRHARSLGDAIGAPAVDFRVLHDGNPGRAVSDFSHEIDASLVVMATHASSGVKRLSAGSVTSHVVRHAACPVLAIAPDLSEEGS